MTPSAPCQRTQAAMLSVALALSTTVPAGAAFAREPDQEREGIAAPEQTAPDSTTDPEYDPGGDTDLSFDIGTPRVGGDDQTEEGPPVDAEPIQDLDLPVPPPRNALAAPTPAESDEPAPPAGLAPEPPATVPAPAPPAPAPVSPPALAVDEQPTDRRSKGQTQRKREHKPKRAQRRPAPPVTVPATPVAPAPAASAPPPVAVASQPAVAAAPARSGRRSHTVQPGESLWTIAHDLLGPAATDDEIAAASSRIYALNRDRIGADPNLVIAGTVLRLP